MGLFGEMPHIFSTEQLLAIVDREIRMRERVYPRRVADGKMSESKADFEIEGMRKVREIVSKVGT